MMLSTYGLFNPLCLFFELDDGAFHGGGWSLLLVFTY